MSENDLPTGPGVEKCWAAAAHHAREVYGLVLAGDWQDETGPLVNRKVVLNATARFVINALMSEAAPPGKPYGDMTEDQLTAFLTDLRAEIDNMY